MDIKATIKAANKLNEETDYPNRYSQCKTTGLVSVSYWDVYTQSRESEHVGHDEAQLQRAERDLYKAMDLHNENCMRARHAVAA